MVKYYRCMSTREFQLVTAGCEIVGKRSYNARTESAGVCFFRGPKMTFSHYTWDGKFETCSLPVENFGRVLPGKHDVMVEFQTEQELTESFGIYADPVNLDYDATIEITEYCIPSYNRDIMRPVRYFVPDETSGWTTRGKWYSCNLN